MAILQKKPGRDVRMLFSPSRLSQKAGREQALPEKYAECADLSALFQSGD
jgi:hypothetical protein